MPGPRTPVGARRPLLARLKVGTKLMLLVLLPVCVLLIFTGLTAAANWRDAVGLRDFRAPTRVSVAAAQAATQIATERTAAVLLGLRPGSQAAAALAAAQRHADQALHQAEGDAVGWTGAADVAGRLHAAGRQLAAVRLEVASRSLPVQQIPQYYGTIVHDLITTASDLVAEPPTTDLDRAQNAYVAIVQAIEAAQRNRSAVAIGLGAPGHSQLSTVNQWVNLESAELDVFHRNASQRLAADLERVLSGPAGIAVQQMRDELVTNPQYAAAHTSLATWLDASGTRIDGLRSLESGAAGELAAIGTQDLHAAVWNGIRDMGLSIAVLAVVAALAFALRRSITGPLRAVSEGARTLSSGKLSFDVRYTGRDEIGDVAAAFRELRLTAERLAEEIRAMNEAIRENRLDHRVDLGVFQGTWAELLRGMNGTMAAFGELQEHRLRAERETTRIFDMSLDLLCIAGFDGYFKRVNPAFEHTLGYPNQTLLSLPTREFVHSEDREQMGEGHGALTGGAEFSRFELRQVCSDGSVRWVEWSARPVPEDGVIYAVGRDVTESRRAADEQAALRRVATLVAKGATPEDVFDAVTAEMHMLLDADNTGLLRYEPDDTATVVATRSDPSLEVPVGTRDSLDSLSVAATVRRTGRPARLDISEGPPGSIPDALGRPGLRSAAGAPVIVEGRLWGVMVAAWRQPQPSSGLEERIAQFTELVATAISNAQAQVDLAASRARIVTASDQARQRIERDLHDGAQQRLVSLALGLRVAQTAVPPGHAGLKTELERAADGLAVVLQELQELCRGIHPVVLSTGGLGQALKGLARRSPVPVQLDVRVPGRLPGPAEMAAYFVVSEALANVAKHAHASMVEVRVGVQGGALQVLIRDDGVGGAHLSRGSGLIGLTDRVEALGGTIDISSPAGAGTRILAELPASDSQRVSADQGRTVFENHKEALQESANGNYITTR